VSDLPVEGGALSPAVACWWDYSPTPGQLGKLGSITFWGSGDPQLQVLYLGATLQSSPGSFYICQVSGCRFCLYCPGVGPALGAFRFVALNHLCRHEVFMFNKHS
jgi:hypothetical protein